MPPYKYRVYPYIDIDCVPILTQRVFLYRNRLYPYADRLCPIQTQIVLPNRHRSCPHMDTDYVLLQRYIVLHIDKYFFSHVDTMCTLNYRHIWCWHIYSLHTLCPHTETCRRGRNSPFRMSSSNRYHLVSSKSSKCHGWMS